MDEIKIKQQAIERIKKAEKILVTVSDSPSVDELSAALGLALLLDKQEKYATAIFSGETPPAIAFLEPEKTFDDTTDSLRDFIIALNKEKADHLRYKVVDDAVKIFITPYKTTITEADLEYSQGDYNVELVIALGVDKQENLDKAIESHGQILHDADIITMTVGNQTSDLGGTDWHDPQASSLSEMVAGLAEALKQDKNKSLLDKGIATALLTGIVAQTDRFSNEHTTSKAMTVAATLMAAGADQQLIATELQIASESPAEEADEDTSSSATEDESPEVSEDEAQEHVEEAPEVAPVVKNKNELSITHDKETLADLDKRVRGDKKAKEKIEAEVEAVEDEEEVAEEPVVEPVAVPVIPAPAPTPVTTPAPAPEPVAAPTYAATSAYALSDASSEEPTLGGTLNATTEQAADDSRRAVENDQNKTILSHSYLGQSGQDSANTNASGAPESAYAAPGSEAVSTEDATEAPGEAPHSAYALTDSEAPDAASALADVIAAQPPAFGGERVIQPLESQPEPNPVPPLTPVANAYGPAAPQESAFGLPLPPPLPDFSQGLPATPPAASVFQPAPQQPELLGDILAPEPATAYAPQPAAPFDAAVAVPIVAPQPTDPAQFKIPGQQ